MNTIGFILTILILCGIYEFVKIIILLIEANKLNKQLARLNELIAMQKLAELEYYHPGAIK